MSRSNTGPDPNDPRVQEDIRTAVKIAGSSIANAVFSTQSGIVGLATAYYSAVRGIPDSAIEGAIQSEVKRQVVGADADAWEQPRAGPVADFAYSTDAFRQSGTSDAGASPSREDILHELRTLAHATYGVNDYHTAAYCYRGVALLDDDAEAKSNLGVFYSHGLGVPENHAEAARWFLAAAEQGEPDAQFNIGRAYLKGDGVAQNTAQALYWLRCAAHNGSVDAVAQLGLVYFDGQGVEGDYYEAVRYFRHAATEGDADSQYMLGEMMGRGLGCERNIPDAISWTRAAAQQGHRRAVAALGQIERPEG